MTDTIALMRKRVLDMAIRGELVEQRPEELIVEILKEENKIENGEVPFSIPENWVWSRLGKIAINHDSKRRPVSLKDRIDQEKIYSYYGATGEIDKVENYLFNGLFLLIGEDGGNFFTEKDNSFIVEGKFWANNHVHVLQFDQLIEIRYMLYFMNSLNFPEMDLITGIAVPKLNQNNLNKILVPLPPLAEQNRIVAKIEKIFAVIDQIGTKKEEALFIIRNMRQTALQDAIMGVLVEQDENDEPASVLYEKIQTEKEQMVKEKKMKKEKPLPAVEEDEIPFEIPESWKWVRLGNIILSIFGGGTPSKAITSYWNGDIPWATVKDISDRDMQLYSTIDFITEDGFNNCSGQMVSKGDIIVITRMGLGRAVISCIDTAINQDLKGIKLPKQLNSKYFLNAYKSISIKGTGTTVKGIKQSSLLNACIPLPPLNEQNRIVEKLDEILAICDQMEAILDGSADMVAERIY